MPELRKDPVASRWVIISTERGRRPSDFGTEPERERAGFCPFCPGNESKTPPEVLAYRSNGGGPNSSGPKFPPASRNNHPWMHSLHQNHGNR